MGGTVSNTAPSCTMATMGLPMLAIMYLPLESNSKAIITQKQQVSGKTTAVALCPACSAAGGEGADPAPSNHTTAFKSRLLTVTGHLDP